ncbi:hypothetical protein MKX03_013947 [Papaver bracteatum]|nr:hypothetical protein MKX03_013947 [Papaver bracteatum]
MAIRNTQKLLGRFNKSINTSAVAITNSTASSSVPNIHEKKSVAAESCSSKTGTKRNESILDLENGEKLFSSIKTSYLMKSLMNQYLVSYDPIVDIGIWIMKSRLMETMVFKSLILGVVKRTFYDHFCAGENLNEASRTLESLWDVGLKGIMDYGLEDANDNFSCDRNLSEFLKTIESTKFLPPFSVSSACVKITAICPISLLKRVSDLLRWEHGDSLFHLPWKIDTFPMLSESSPFYHTLTKPNHLTSIEEHDLAQAHERLLQLSEKCLEMNLPLLVDAEYSSVQPAIDYLTYSSMIKINRHEIPIVYGTIQAYLKDSKERLLLATEAAEKMGVKVGYKLVRGAYLSSELQLASSLGCSSPIHNTIQDTHECYNECASIMLDKVANGTGAIVLATHNLNSGRVAAAKAQELGLGKSNPKLQFAQLKGMADGLSFALKNAGFQVSKYLPYGPVDMVIPYLLRRAEENRGMLSTSTIDRELMKHEVLRRFKASIRSTK